MPAEQARCGQATEDETSLRESCRRLAEDESLPIVEIFKSAFVGKRLPLTNDRFTAFAEQLAYLIKSHAQT